MQLEDALRSVWQQVMADGANTVTLGEASYPVHRTTRSKLREVEFPVEGRNLRAVEQNPHTNSRWAQLARQGKKVMQFTEDRRYVAVVVDGKVTMYGHLAGGNKSSS